MYIYIFGLYPSLLRQRSFKPSRLGSMPTGPISGLIIILKLTYVDTLSNNKT